MNENPASSYLLEKNEADHLVRLTVSRNSARLRLLEVMQQLEAAQAAVKAMLESTAQQDVQLGSAVAMVAAARGETEFQEWAASADCKSIVRQQR